MSPRTRPERTSTAPLDRGLYVLRYVSSDAPDPPLVHVRPSYGSEDALNIVSPPSFSTPTLPRPGTALVILANQRASLQMTVQSQSGSAALDAQLRLEPLHDTSTSVSPAPDSRRANDPAPQLTESAKFRLVGHVARQGDVQTSPGNWLAGPDAPAPIEGISIAAPPTGPKIEYQVVIRGSERWSEWMHSGQYAGSKGQALALVGVRLRLQGSAARDFILKGAALFLGSAVIEHSGPLIEMRSVAGHDPLVGLMVDVVAQPAVRPVAAPVAASSNEQTPRTAERKGRVRVFRAGVEQRLD